MVEIIPKKPIRGLPFTSILLFAAGALFLVSIFSYVILFKAEVETLLAIQDVEEGIYKVGTKEDRRIEETVFASEKKIKNFKDLSVSRLELSKFFDNFDGLIHPRVWFSFFELDPVEMTAVLAGQSSDFRALEQQMIFLRSRNDIVKSLDLSEVAIEKSGDVIFRLTINFTPNIFNTLEK